MDAAGLVLAVISVFKDGYLVGKFIYNTVNSGIHREEELDEINRKLRRQLLFHQSFGFLFVKFRGEITSDETLNRAWLQEIRSILEELKDDLAQYRELAEKNDHQYQKYSPVLNPKYQKSGLIEFELGQELASIHEPNVVSRVTKFFSKSAAAGEWALFGKRKLNKLISRFEERNETLQQIMQVAVPNQLRASKPSRPAGDGWIDTHHLDRIGLRGHAQIAQIQITPYHNSADLEIKKVQLDYKSPILGSTITPGKLAVEKARNNIQNESVLIEFKHYELDVNVTAKQGSQVEDSTKNKTRMEKLAAVLKSSGDHNLGTLPFKGFIPQSKEHRYAFIFKYPTEADKKQPPRTLNDLIENDPDPEFPKPWPLAQRFHSARKLANILEAFHNDGWVHKSIRSQSVAFFYDKTNKELALRELFLVNFEYTRLSDKTTYLERDEDREKDLYRHPVLQVAPRREPFSVVHDIYALGVVLLEIALWKTAAQIVEGCPEKEKLRSAADIRRYYTKVAKSEVPWLMGDSFLAAILACLNDRDGEDEDENDFISPDTGAFRREVIEKLSPQALTVGKS